MYSIIKYAYKCDRSVRARERERWNNKEKTARGMVDLPVNGWGTREEW